MASCSSPPKKRPKLSLKFMRKLDRTQTTDDDDVSQSGSSGGIRHNSSPNGQSNATGGPTTTDTSRTQSTKDSQLEVVRSPPPPFAGLQNLGNTCYLNSVLQALRFCPGFCQGLCQLTSVWEGIMEQTRVEEGAGEGDWRGCGREMQFVLNLKKLYDKMSAKEADYMASPSTDAPISLSPDEVLETVRDLNPMFQGFLQHDSQELLCCLLSYVLDACQSLKKQLVKLHPLSPLHGKNDKQSCIHPVEGDSSKNDVVPKTEKCEGQEHGKCTAFDDKSDRVADIESLKTEDSQMKEELGKRLETEQKDSVVSENGALNIGNGKKTPRRRSRTSSSDSVSRKAKIQSSGNGKKNGRLINGFADHTADAEAAKKKRLGKFRVPDKQTTLFSAFAPLKKEAPPPNGIRKDLQSDVFSAQVNRVDVGLNINDLTDSAVGVAKKQTDQPDQLNSENELNADSSKTSPTVNGKGFTELKKTASTQSVDTNISELSSTSVEVQRSASGDCKALNDVPNPQMNSMEREFELIKRLFQGALVLRTRCNECESYTERREEFQDISLPVRSIPRCTGDDDDEGVPEVSPADLSLSWAISEFACVERLTDDNKYFCEHCRHHAEAERSMLFGELPPVLTIHLKRFSAFSGFLTADSTVSKVNDHLATPLSLRLSQWCARQCQQLHCTYHLCAVVMHSGVSSSSGHYISYVQIPDRCHPASGSKYPEVERDTDSGEPRWGKFDDEKVSIMTQQELASSVLHPVSSSGSAATPYLLFYRQVQELDS